MKTFKEVLREAILKDDEIDFYDIFIANWPNDEEGDGQDVENWSIISLSDDKMVMCCGGDWQEPVKMTIELVDEKLTVTETEFGIYDDGMSIEAIINFLNN